MQALRATAFGGAVRQARLPLVAAPEQVLADPPVPPVTETSAAGAAAQGSAIFPTLRRAVEQAQHAATFVTPSFVPGPDTEAVLCALVQRGVRVLSNSLASTGVPVVHAGDARHRPQRLACGVALHELRPQATGPAAGPVRRLGLSCGASLHAKAIVIDGQTLFIGSMHLDPRSRALNTAIALRVLSLVLGAQRERLFDEATALDQA